MVSTSCKEKTKASHGGLHCPLCRPGSPGGARILGVAAPPSHRYGTAHPLPPIRDKDFSILRKNIRFEKLNLSLCRILPDFFRRLRPHPVFYRLKREIFRPETTKMKYFLIISARSLTLAR